MRKIGTVSHSGISARWNHEEKLIPNMVGMHIHDSYELFCFLSGHARYYIEGNLYPLKPGDILLIKKAEVHTLLADKITPYTSIVVHFHEADILDTPDQDLLHFLNDRPIGQQNRFPASLFKDKPWLYYLRQCVNTKDSHAKRLYLSSILNELYENRNRIIARQPERDRLTEILTYINIHLCDSISVDDICTHFYTSQSYLNQKIRMLTGASIWEYITVKRMYLAKDLLSCGKSPTVVCSECGYNDYSAFYRAYKRQFGHSPATDHIK